MKRSREIVKTNNNDNCDLPTTTKCKKPKLQPLYRAFDRLPNELVEMIMHAVPYSLYGIIRLVCASWCGAVDKSWASFSGRNDPEDKIPIFRSMAGNWAIRNHNLPLLKWLVTTEGVRPISKFKDNWIENCANYENMEALQWLMKPSTGVYIHPQGQEWRYEPKRKAMIAMARGKKTKMFQWITTNEFGRQIPMFTDMLYAACRGGNLETAAIVMAVLKRQASFFSIEKCYQHAAKSGQVHVLDWLWTRFEKNRILGAHLIYDATAWRRDLKVIKWFQQRQTGGLVNLEKNIVAAAVRNRNVTVLNWWWKGDQGPFGKEKHKAYEGINCFDYRLVEWLHKRNRLLITVASLKMAVRGSFRDVGMLNWLWNHHADTEKLEADMKRNHVNDGDTMSFMNVWEDAHSPSESLRYIAKRGVKCIPALNWFWDHGMTVEKRPEAVHGFHTIIKKLAKAKELETLRWLHHHNCVNLSKACIYAINGCVDLEPYPSFLEGSCLLISPSSSE